MLIYCPAFSGAEAIVGELTNVRVPRATWSPRCWVLFHLLLDFDGPALSLILVSAILQDVVKVKV